MTEFLSVSISSMPQLKVLDLSRNPLTGKSIVHLYAGIVKLGYPLGSLNITGCQLMDEGLAELLTEVLAPGSNLEYLNLTACRLTEQSKHSLVNFLSKFELHRKMTLDLRL